MEIIIKPITIIFIALGKLYQLFISPILPVSCRYTPTCSQYFIESLKSLGLLKGLYLTFKRLISCRPGGGCGHDPVPKKKVDLSE